MARIIDSLFLTYLRLPNFRGKVRLLKLLRNGIYRVSPTTVLDGLRMQLDPLEWPQSDIMERRVLEPLTTGLLGRLLRPGDTYLDVGAHVGMHTLAARKSVGPEGSVIAVEPQPYNADRILINWGLNGFANLTLYVAAAGAQAGSFALSPQPDSDRSKLSLLDSAPADSQPRFIVPLLRLDRILEENKVARLQLLKVDVEGYELSVIEGLGGRLADVRNIIFEALPPGLHVKVDHAPLLALLRGAGFQIRTVEGREWELGQPLPENNVWAARA